MKLKHTKISAKLMSLSQSQNHLLPCLLHGQEIDLYMKVMKH